MESKFWIVSNRVLSGRDLKEQTLALMIRGAYIERVEAASALRSGPIGEEARRAGVEVIDVGSCPLVPAFENAHTHLALTALRGVTSVAARSGNVVSEVFFRLESKMTAEDVSAFTALGAYESLLAGVGRVWDHFYFGETVAEALAFVGMTGVVAPTLQDRSGPGASQTEAQLDATRKIAESRRFSSLGIAAAYGPHASDTVSQELMAHIGDWARRDSLPVHLHLAQAFEEMEQLNGRNVKLCLEALQGARVLMAHGLYLRRDQVQSLVDSNWVLSYCPLSQLQFGFLSPIAEWLQVGGKWALGTDCVASNDAWDVQRELPFVAGEASLQASFSRARKRFLSAGASAYEVEHQRRIALSSGVALSPVELLNGASGSAFSGPAVLTKGALANFLVLDPDHPSLFPGEDLVRTLVYGATSGAILWSVTGGRIRGRKDGLVREVTSSVEYQDVLVEVRRRRDELFARAKMSEVPVTS